MHHHQLGVKIMTHEVKTKEYGRFGIHTDVHLEKAFCRMHVVLSLAMCVRSLLSAKGQLISKANFQAVDSLNNKRTNFLFLT